LTITSLSNYLNIKKSSCSKMISKLKSLELINNNLTLTKEGLKIAQYLYHRHEILEAFLKDLNQENFKLKQVEKLEHFIDEKNINKENIKLDKVKKLEHLIDEITLINIEKRLKN